MGRMAHEGPSGFGGGDAAAPHARRRLLLASSSMGLLPLMRRFLGVRRGAVIGFVPNASLVEPYGFANRMTAPSSASSRTRASSSHTASRTG
ncbi:peptidase [Bifidobacterium italicum]|uniref:Peptidase n=1 Tax=Bifidobacterium italicum TaxID=1960968 RepID=A0A2A2EIX3_9BIFI|nr:hypothetical protein [Bifidobacterium italicum]PAU69174.1 peptidase [Bifidobacterium italicum]